MEKVSIIIPVYNSCKYLEECLNSVINQTYKNLEIILVDDQSTDESVEIIKRFKDKRIKLIELKTNSGVAIARNRGIEESTGSFLCFLDSDDYWYLDKIEKQVQFMKKNKYEFIYGDYAYLKGNKIHHSTHVPKHLTYEQALKNTTIFTSTVMFDMKKLRKEDITMPNIRRGQDTATWWKVLKNGITAYGMNGVVSVYRVREKSLSSNKIKALKRTWQLYKREDINYFKKIYCFMCYAFNAVKRRFL